MRAARPLLLLLMLCAATAARAATTGYAIEGGLRGATPAARSLGVWLGPALGLEGRRVSLALDGRLGDAPLTAGDPGGRLRLCALLGERGPLRSELVVLAAAQGLDRQAREAVRLHLAGSAAGAWVSGAAEAAAPGGTRPSLHVPLVGFGAWARSDRLMLAGAVEQHVGLVRARHQASPPDSVRGTGANDLGKVSALTLDPRQLMLSSAYASVRWSGDRFELESIGGVTVGRHAAPWRWSQTSLAWKLTPQLALVGTAGSLSPRYFALDPVGDRQAALSLRFSQASGAAAPITLASRAQALDCRIRPMGEGLWRVAVRAPGARLVELQGDVTGWQAIPLRRAGGAWEAELELAPGIHQMALRVDGGSWLPPPGLPTAPDGFGGSVGVVAIE